MALGPLAANAQPAAPTNLRAVAGDQEARLEWDDPQNPAIVRYEFRLGAGAMPTFGPWAEVPASDAQTVMHTVSGLVNGTRYAFEVRAAAQDAAGPAARARTTLAASPKSTVAVPDAKLRDDIRDALELAGATITQGDLAKLTHLVGSRRGVADLAGLEYAVNLDHVVLSNNEISDVSALSGLSLLSVLDLRDNDISDLSPLSALTSLGALYLSDNDIADLSPLSRLTSLAVLYLENNRISDIAALESLAMLTELILSGNDIVDVSALSALASLSELDLWGNDITDVSALSALTSLRSLNLSGNNISDVSALSALRSLDALYLAGNVVADVATLKTLTALSTLDLSDNAISDASALSALTSLWVLRLSANAIADVSALSGLASLAELNLASNAISDASPLSGLASLANLNLSGNAVSDVSALSGLAALQTLDLSSNVMRDVSGVSGMAALRVLDLTGNDIADASGLSGFTNLAVLHLSGNDLSEVPDLSGFRSLRVLHLSDNQLSHISALTGLESLRVLRLDGNAITKVSALRGLTLSSLNLRNNAIPDISPLAETEFLRAEGYVDLRGNPLRRGEGGGEEQVQALRKRRMVVVFDDGGHRVPLFPSAQSATAGSGAQGFVRVINHSAEAGAISIEAVDEAGERRGPLSLAIDAGQALHFNAEDLEQGNAAKGLGGIGEAVGDWRLVVRSELDIEVLGYARTPDGFVTSLHDLTAETYGTSRVPTFNPGSNRHQVSRLRLVNPTDEEAFAALSSTDDKGNARDGTIDVKARRTLDLAADRLESGEAIPNFVGIGDGTGKWRLTVVAPGVRVMSLLQSPMGHLANISAGTAVSSSDTRPLGRGERYRVPLFLAASRDIQGFLRLVNLSYWRTIVTLRAFDADGVERQAATLTLRGGEAMHFNSRHFEEGDSARGLPGVGAGTGDWHFEVSANRRIETLAYARTADGFVTSLHDTAPRLEDGSLWIPFFNPGSNRRQASRLRLVNWGETAAEATITGVDDTGSSPDDGVQVTIPARSARDYMAWQLEAGDAPGLSGALGDGSGKWRLRVATTGDVEAMSLLSLATGHIANLSTTPKHPRQ